MPTDTEIDNLLALHGAYRWLDPTRMGNVFVISRIGDRQALAVWGFSRPIEYYIRDLPRVLGADYEVYAPQTRAAGRVSRVREPCMKAPQPRKSLSRAVRNYLALHSYTAERRGDGLYNIFDAEGGWLGEGLYCYSVEEIVEIIGGLVIGEFPPGTPEEPW